MDKNKAEYYNRFFNNPDVAFSETEAVIYGKKVGYSTGDPEVDGKLLKLAERLACLQTLQAAILAGPKKALIPFYKELWTRFLKTLVASSDEYRWSTKLFADRPLLQWPYFMLESASNLEGASAEELKCVIDPAMSVIEYCISEFKIS